MDHLAPQVAGWAFIAAALMLWLGWVLLPVKLGTFFDAKDFPHIHACFRRWIWLFRVHLFGHVVTTMALVALGVLLAGTAERIVAWPGIAVACAGLMVSALAAAFYYHFGAWGALGMHGKANDHIESFVGSLRVSTEYVTCLVRFGRVFFGLGQLVLAIGLFVGGALPSWVAFGAAVLGISAMALTMGFPDNLEYYAPVFHLNALWLAGSGIAVLMLPPGLGG
jgi:hypothetical protein